VNRYALTGLIKIEFPTGTVRLCDGGFFVWGAETYLSKDPVFGTLASLDGLSEGVGDEIPALEMTLMPPGTTLPGDLSQPGFQAARARFWLAEYDVVTGLLDGTPELQFDGQVDQTTLTVGRDRRELAISVVSSAERLFQRNIGNSLNPSFHKSVWAGETGEDNATGLGRAVAWGVEAPPAVGTGQGRGIARWANVLAGAA
jgi:hypothetical protein